MEIVEVPESLSSEDYLDEYHEVALIATPTTWWQILRMAMGRVVTNLEATKVSDEENQEADWTSAVGSISERNAKYSKVL